MFHCSFDLPKELNLLLQAIVIVVTVAFVQVR